LSPFGIPLFGLDHPNALTSPALLNWISAAAAPAFANRNLVLGGTAPSGFWPRGIWTNHAYSADGRTFAISTENGLVALCDAAKREKLAVLQGRLHAVFGIAFTPDGTRLAVANDALWDVATRQELLTLHAEGTLHHLAEFSDDGSTLLIGNPEQAGFCQFWRAPSWKEIDEVERAGDAWPPTAE
jgi:WD40 repeat protein